MIRPYKAREIPGRLLKKSQASARQGASRRKSAVYTSVSRFAAPHFEPICNAVLCRMRVLQQPARRGTRLLARMMFAVLMACADIAMAAGEDGPPPTLQEVVASAYARLPQRQTLDAQAGEVDALTRRSDSLIADSPSLDTGYRTDQVGSQDGYREWEAGMSLPLWKPGQRRAEQELARRAASVVEQQASVLMLAVAGEVRERIWDAERMHNNVELAKKEWDTAVSLERNVQRRVELGELAKMDLLLARDATLSKRAAYLRAQTDLENARRRYVSYTGLSRLPPRQGETRSALTAVPEAHPQLAEAGAGVNQARAQVVATRRAGAGAPVLFVGATGERGDSDSDFDNRLGLSLSLPIGVTAHKRTAISAAERARAEAQAEYDDRHRRLVLALEEAQQELESAQAQLGVAQEQNALAQENLRLAQIAFDRGETDLVGLLRVQGLAFAAERQEKELSIMRQQAVARYNQALGVLP
jgi:cobalt-zinc-cadmium efflux system outer membrane protein